MSTRYCQCVQEEPLEVCDVCREDDDDDDDSVWFKCTQLGTFIASRDFLLVKGTAYISLNHLLSGSDMTVFNKLVFNYMKKLKPSLLQYLNDKHFPDGNFKFISDLVQGMRFTNIVPKPLNLDMSNAPACWKHVFTIPMRNATRWRIARVVAGATVKQPLVKDAKQLMSRYQGSKATERIADFQRDIAHASSTEKYDNQFCYYWGPAGIDICPYAKDGVDHMRECLKHRTPFPQGQKQTIRNVWAFTKPIIAYQA